MGDEDGCYRRSGVHAHFVIPLGPVVEAFGGENASRDELRCCQARYAVMEQRKRAIQRDPAVVRLELSGRTPGPVRP